jgi:copper chaperone CopZ
MKKIKVVNIKCGGCEAGIIKALEKAGLKNIKVDVANQEVYFDGDEKMAEEVLNKIGYPKADSEEARSILKKAKSYQTCAVGSVSEGLEKKEKRTKKF